MTIYLDTNVLVWLHAKKRSTFSQKALKLIENNQLITGEINILELEYLEEIGRTKYNGTSIYNSLSSDMGLKLVDVSSRAILRAMDIGWTRDLFDRITVAGAMVLDTKLVTKDAHILDNFHLAVW
jgi:PIN domain nuclease of toxin-antitoxin system